MILLSALLYLAEVRKKKEDIIQRGYAGSLHLNAGRAAIMEIIIIFPDSAWCAA